MNVSTHFWKNKNPGKRSLKIFFSMRTTCNNSLKSKGNHFMWKLEFINRLTDVWEYYTGFPEGLSSSRIPLWAGEIVINLLLVIWQVNVGPKLDCFKRSSSPPPRAANVTNVSANVKREWWKTAHRTNYRMNRVITHLLIRRCRFIIWVVLVVTLLLIFLL